MNTRSLRGALIVVALGLAACTPAKRTTQPGQAPRDHNLITADEIAKISVTNAYDVVKRLRPQFLTSRGPTSITDRRPTTPVVYLDGVRYGDVSALMGIDAARIATIRFLSGPEAQARFGTDNVAGAILVTTKL
ncbi:MAG TPA: hypothetical protein VHM30_02515 [Gemmatimonadaceae bacterium]|nr:hypothetical protein [Gemmatimonadaceae bacterium]